MVKEINIWKKLLIVCIKFMPVIQMAGIIVSNTLYFLDIYYFSYLIDYIIGNSVIITILLLICSYIFKFCIWHRLFILSNIINISIGFIDCIYKLPINDIILLLIYYIISCLFITISVIIHINKKNKYL